MRLPSAFRHGLVYLALVSLAAAGCGDDDNGNGPPIDADDQPPIDADDEPPVDAGDQRLEDPVTYVNELVIPPIEDDEPRCCRDFGEISKPKIEQDEDRIDNAWAELTSALDAAIGSDFQGTLDQQIEDGILALLGVHVGLEDEGDVFAVEALRGVFAEGTTFEDANAGNGVFTVDPGSFDDQGEPRIRFDGAEIDEGVVAASADEVLLQIPLGELAVAFRTHDAQISGEITLSDDGATYTGGEMSGYFVVDEMFESFNQLVTSEGCACLGLDGDPVFVQDGEGDWEAQCVEAHSCDPDSICTTLGAEGGPCELVPDAIDDHADLDLDAGADGEFEGFSVGFEWAGVPADVLID